MSSHPDTSKPEGRPFHVVGKPTWYVLPAIQNPTNPRSRFGSSINPAIPMAGSGDAPNPVATETERREVTLPPGMGEREFERAIEGLRGLVGGEYVKVNDGPLNDGECDASE